MNKRSKLPSFASGVLITCPAIAIQEHPEWGACFKPVNLSAKEWEEGKKGYCDKHKYLETLYTE